MANPSLTRTWTVSQNNSPSDQTSTSAQTKEILLDMKNKMVAAGWTVTQSSDSSSTDTSDLWLNTTKIVNSTSAHSWVILRSPANYPSTGNYIYFAIDYDSSNDYQVAFAARGDADWSSLTTSSGPSDSANSTNYSSIIVWSTTRGYIRPSSVRDCKYHSYASNIGDFIYQVSDNDDGLCRFQLVINKLSNSQTGDSYPVVFFLRGTSNASLGFSSQGSYYTNMQSTTYTQMLHYSTGLGGNSNNGAGFGFPGDSNFWNSTVATGDDIDGFVPAVPMLVAGNDTNTQAIRGVATDIYMCNFNSEVVPVGTVTPATGDIVFGNTGQLMVPCDVAPNFGT